ncbi:MULTISPECIES: mevalonate kinase [unclassified Lactobacillus]|uniref:mevalonate kinase n=1 Tax=unclassified Lactobacillus TaxID=2620435 RepID=UPI000EFA86DD|nr:MULTISPECIES: mevalonate kinase [unclassified Lactobacillus]RMC24644.1 mevalonate kinase [Lactobacillus sp. ESL0247]RMC28916.1 mevalonate kinase [Lactobacillus sp. ESL0246]RMC32161.1 mevalonate kinase [Lactobacillus sp. ESL0245]
MKCSYLAHGKVILIGEHSVVYGYNALSIPIMALHIKVTVEPSSELLMNTTHYQGPFFMAPSSYNGLKYVLKTMQAKAASTEQIKITYTGEIPPERGLGSSATVALATTKVLDEYFNLNLSDADIMAITNHAEMINHGKASGLDAATVKSSYPIFFNSQEGPQEIKSRLHASLLIMDTGELGNTKQAVNQVHELIQRSRQAKNNLKRLGKLADETKDVWLNHDKITLGQIFNQAQLLLHSFNLSTAKIDQLQDLALSNNALGCKLSGSGLGGIVIVLCSDHQTAEKIAQKANKLVENSWIEEI